ERANAMALSFQRGQLTSLDNIFTIADGIAVKSPGETTFKYIEEYVDDIVTVNDDEIASAIIRLIERTKLVAEPAGAAGLAAVLHSKFKLGPNTAVVISGGNIDVGFMSKIIERGLVSRGRQLRFSVILADKPGSLEKFARIMGRNNANIVSVQYDRMSTELHLNETILHIAAEVGGTEHGEKVLTDLEAAGYVIRGRKK
ncbi:pyridoxal-phosphate dependent enzyme, partial [Candidatus Saccharibacteria bacterium]|nr:pyridoxal-phosphate dependent enzyme [Candidatus Saccharibacteria bacterium]